jgi:hypothetical protein
LRPKPWAVRVLRPKPEAADREAALGSMLSPTCREGVEKLKTIDSQ